MLCSHELDQSFDSFHSAKKAAFLWASELLVAFHLCAVFRGETSCNFINLYQIPLKLVDFGENNPFIFVFFKQMLINFLVLVLADIVMVIGAVFVGYASCLLHQGFGPAFFLKFVSIIYPSFLSE